MTITKEIPQTSTALQMQAPDFWTTVWAVVWKDLTVERHTRQITSVMLMFSLATVVMFNFALEADLAAARSVSTGLLWATILLAGTLGLNRTMNSERENRSFDAVLIAPVNRMALYLGKVLSSTLLMLLLEAILIFVFSVFFNKPFWRPQVVFMLVAGTIGYMAAGILIASMTMQTRSRAVLLPVLLLPLSLPCVLMAATATARFMLPEGTVWAEVQGPVALVLAYDLLMLLTGFLTYRYVVDE